MAGIQTRGRNRITTNKLNQLKIHQQNNINNQAHLDKISSPTYKESQTNWPSQQRQPDGSYGQNIPPVASVRQDTTTTSYGDGSSDIKDSDIMPTNTYNEYIPKETKKIELHGNNRFKRTVHGPGNKLRNDDPMSQVMLGIGNTFQDYGGLVQGGYEDKSILNQSIGKAIEGDWDGAGKLIQDNPYRFAGNLIVEAGSALIPVGAVLKVAKVAKVTDKVLKNVKKVIPKKTIDGEEVRTLYNIRPAGEGPGMWYANIADGFYHNKIISGGAKTIEGNLIKDGVPQLRSVDVPKSVYDKFRVSEILKTSDTPYVPAKSFTGLKTWSDEADAFVPQTTTYAETPRSIVEAMRFTDQTIVSGKQLNPNAIGEHRSSEFLTKLTNKNTPGATPDEVIRQKNLQANEKIAAHLRLNSFDPTNEWALKHRWQKTEKILATSGQKESVFKRIFNPGMSSDKYANELVKTYKKKNKTVKELDFFENSHQKYGGSVDSPPSFQKARGMLQQYEQGIEPRPLSPMFTAAAGVGGLQVLSKNNTMQRGQERQNRYTSKQAKAEENPMDWDPRATPPSLMEPPPFTYSRPGLNDKPFWEDKSKDWMQNKSPFDPWGNRDNI